MSMSRRKFLGSAASAVIVAGTMAKGRVFGANERVNVCVMGINGRGQIVQSGVGIPADGKGTLCYTSFATFTSTITATHSTNGFAGQRRTIGLMTLGCERTAMTIASSTRPQRTVLISILTF